MESLEHRDKLEVLPVKASPVDQIALYDRYSAMAYGIILQIVPQPELAQKILVDLFTDLLRTSPDLNDSGLGCTIIRMARLRSLETRRSADSVAERSGTSFSPTQGNLPKVVFNLSFWHGCHPNEIAERLQISGSDVMKAIREYIKSFQAS
ncbi:hypothetical protein GCM10027578_11030 [Spirosoma luteolum]